MTVFTVSIGCKQRETTVPAQAPATALDLTDSDAVDCASGNASDAGCLLCGLGRRREWIDFEEETEAVDIESLYCARMLGLEGLGAALAKNRRPLVLASAVSKAISLFQWFPWFSTCSAILEAT